MKKLNVLLITLMLTVIVGCGGGNSSVSDDKNETIDTNNSYEILKNDANVEPIYKYNSDNSALLKLNNSRVNEYKSVEENLSNLQYSQEDFNNRIYRYVDELLYFNSLIDNTPSYAPRGNNKNFVVEVINGKVDYSKYKLNGDIDGNFKVDFEDISLLINALYNNLDDIKYDSNKDEVIDLKDLIYTLARVSSEIVYFDFYDLNGQKLNILTRTINDSKSFDYNGSENQILLVAKDQNYASGYINGGLSDSYKEWYHQKGWKAEEYTDKLIYFKSVNQDIIQNCREIIDKEIEPYLTGWHFVVNFVSDANLEEFGENSYSVESWRWFFESEIEPKIKSHFTKTKMNLPIKKYLDSYHYYYHIGYASDDEITQVYNKNISLKRSFVLDNKRVVLKQLVHISSILFESKADKILKAHIKSSKKLNGKVQLKRVGPTPKEDKFDGEVNDNEVEANDVPSGAYDIEMETECGCKITLAQKAVFIGKKLNLSVDVSRLKANITLIVKDKNNKRVKNKQVTIESKDCIENKFTKIKTTNSSGEVTFESIPIGEYKVTVSGNIFDIKVCKSTTKTLTLTDNKWIYRWINNDAYYSGSITIKNLSIDCNNMITIASHDMCQVIYEDNDVSVTGNFGVDLEESYITIEEDGIMLSVKNLHEVGFEDIFAIATKTEYTGMCYFTWKDEYFENLKSHKSFTIIGDRCTVEFKTCSDEECSE